MSNEEKLRIAVEALKKIRGYASSGIRGHYFHIADKALKRIGEDDEV